MHLFGNMNLLRVIVAQTTGCFFFLRSMLRLHVRLRKINQFLLTVWGFEEVDKEMRLLLIFIDGGFIHL